MTGIDWLSIGRIELRGVLRFQRRGRGNETVIRQAAARAVGGRARLGAFAAAPGWRFLPEDRSRCGRDALEDELSAALEPYGLAGGARDT